MTQTADVPPHAHVPEGWEAQVPTADLLASAKKSTLRALADDGPFPVASRLGRFYTVDSDWAGATFVNLQPNDPRDLTASDLLALTLMNVSAKPGAVRRILTEGERHRNELLERLAELPDQDLVTCGADGLQNLENLYQAVVKVLSGTHVARPKSWVTASKLCARKRPDLFPVRDELVCGYLGLLTDPWWRRDYLVFKHLVGQPDVQRALGEAVDAARGWAKADGRRAEFDTEPLRLLDAALWTFVKDRDNATGIKRR